MEFEYQFFPLFFLELEAILDEVSCWDCPVGGGWCWIVGNIFVVCFVYLVGIFAGDIIGWSTGFFYLGLGPLS